MPALVEIIEALPAGITELACHPGLGDDSGSTYDRERTQEVEVLCDPRVREALDREGVGAALVHRHGVGQARRKR